MKDRFSITRRIEIDAAHRVPDHKSKCFAVHGHRYVIEATCSGSLLTGEQEGMVMDFGFLKECMMGTIHKHCDHGLILFMDDPILATIMPAQNWWKLRLINTVPTAENLARIWYIEVDNAIDRFFATPGFNTMAARPKLENITVWETPNCKATYPW